MVRKIVIFCIFSGILAATQVQVTADNFVIDEKSLSGDLSGNVVITKQKDILKANRVKILFNQKKQPLRYTASGSPNFEVFVNDKKYKGSGNNLIYEPNEDRYTIEGNAFLHEIATDKKIYGDKIVVNQKTGVYSVNSKEKTPVRLIFNIEDRK